jgi:hypothetical protein
MLPSGLLSAGPAGGPKSDDQLVINVTVSKLSKLQRWENSRITVKDFFDKWITTYAEGNVSAKTLEG